MKNIVHALALCLILTACAEKKGKLSDGIYLVLQQNNKHAESSAVIKFNPEFLSGADPQEIRVSTAEFVPLELKEKPDTMLSSNRNTILLLSLDSNASEKLKTFTAHNISKTVVIVVEGEALTMHKVRDTISGGKLQLTRCSDNACEKIQKVLVDNVKE